MSNKNVRNKPKYMYLENNVIFFMSLCASSRPWDDSSGNADEADSLI